MLLRRIEQFIKERRMPPARFGREAVGDPCFVFDLRDGREPRQRTVARVSAYLDRAEQAKCS
jgi:2,4-dienoyl-CoA reductase-like NADH-dependent reductase (Old Yellow Enzyme family)